MLTVLSSYESECTGLSSPKLLKRRSCPASDLLKRINKEHSYDSLRGLLSLTLVTFIAYVCLVLLLGMIVYPKFTISGRAYYQSGLMVSEYRGMGHSESVIERRIRGLTRASLSMTSEESELAKRTLGFLLKRRGEVGRVARAVVESPSRLSGPDDHDFPSLYVPWHSVTIAIGAVFFVWGFLSIVIMDFTGSAFFTLVIAIPLQLLLAILFFASVLHERGETGKNRARIEEVMCYP